MIVHTVLVRPSRPKAVVLSFVLFLASCASQLSAPLHAVVTKNVGTENIKQVEIHYAPPIVFRDLTPKTPGRQQTDIGDRPIPEIMKVKWTLEDGRNFEEDVPLRRYIPIVGKLSGIEILFNGPSIEVLRAMRRSDSPLEDIKERIYRSGN